MSDTLERLREREPITSETPRTGWEIVEFAPYVPLSVPGFRALLAVAEAAQKARDLADVLSSEFKVSDHKAALKFAIVAANLDKPLASLDAAGGAEG